MPAMCFTVRRIVCGGYSSRDQAEVERHIRELERLGIPGPQDIPIFFSVASYLATVGGVVEVQGPFTSGEVEEHWDDLTLRSWVRSGRKRRLYQEAALGTMLPPGALLPGLRRHAGRELEGVALFSGTVPTVDGELIYGDGYELELEDPRLERRIRAQYTVHVLESGKH